MEKTLSQQEVDTIRELLAKFSPQEEVYKSLNAILIKHTMLKEINIPPEHYQSLLKTQVIALIEVLLEKDKNLNDDHYVSLMRCLDLSNAQLEALVALFLSPHRLPSELVDFPVTKIPKIQKLGECINNERYFLNALDIREFALCSPETLAKKYQVQEEPKPNHTFSCG